MCSQWPADISRLSASPPGHSMNVPPISVVILLSLDCPCAFISRRISGLWHHVRQSLQPFSHEFDYGPRVNGAVPGSIIQQRFSDTTKLRSSSLAMGSGCAARSAGSLPCPDVWTSNGERSEKGDHRKLPRLNASYPSRLQEGESYRLPTPFYRSYSLAMSPQMSS